MEQSLKYAEENKIELVNALKYFQQDSLKLEAAKYLFCMNRFVIFLISIVLLYSCSSNESRRINELFPKKIRLEADKIKILEIIKPALIITLENYLVIQNEYIPGNDCFFIYSLESYKFLGSFGRLGQGPDDFIAPRLIQNSKGNTLSIFDQASRIIHKFQITDSEPVFIEKIKIEDSRKEPFQDLSYLNDSIILLIKYDYELCTYHINERQFLDTLSFETDIKNKLGEKYSPSLEAFRFSNYKDKIVIGHHYINNLSVGKIENDKFIIKNKKLTSTEISPGAFVEYKLNDL